MRREFLVVIFLVLSLVSFVVWYAICLFRQRKRKERELLLERELQQSEMEREKEEQIREERERFFTNVAHELGTPLTLLLSPLQDLLHKATPCTPTYQALALMHENGIYLHRLFDDLLYIKRIEAGMVRLQISEVNIVEIIKDVSASFYPVAQLQGIDYNCDFLPESVMLWVDVEKITSALRNLLSNAFKYTPSQGGRISLSSERKEIDGKPFFHLSISDNGMGIPFPLQERIFDSFITEPYSPALSTGVGIGLRVVKNTMDLHHGIVSLQSEPGQGSVFTLSIPEGRTHFTEENYEIVDYQPVQSSLGEQEMTILQPAEDYLPASEGKKHCLLIIEDNADMRRYICSLFCKNYILFEATNGEQGVKLATEILPDLIISDLMIPGKEGFACCREIREQQETAHIPILILTAKAEDSDIIKGMKAGADEFLMKPFNPEVLRVKVERLILQREQLKQIYTKLLMLKQSSSTRESREDTFMQKVINCIEINLTNEQFSVQALAKLLNMSQPTLYRKTKQHSDLSIIEVIRSVRVSKAAGLIMENKYSIREISEMVGYNDSNTFRKHFTEQFGVPPSKYMQ